MFDLENKVKNSLSAKNWSRGAIIYRQGKVGDIIIEDKNNILTLRTYVEGNYDNQYNTFISINRNNGSIKSNCSCPANTYYVGCKHVGALAREIGNEYSIDDEFNITNNQGDIIFQPNIHNNEEDDDDDYDDDDYDDDEDDYYDEESLTNINKEMFDRMKTDDEYARKLILKAGIPIEQLPEKMFPKLKKELLDEFDRKFHFSSKSDKLDIFTKIKNNKIKEHENLYKIKLNFLESRYDDSLDMEMNLFECKRLKNGKLSTGTQKYGSSIYKDTPKTIKKLKLFFDRSSSSYYYSSERSGITYLKSPEYFMQHLFELEEVFDRNNNQLNIERAVYEPKISVKENKQGDFDIKLVLPNTKKGDIFFKNFKIIGEKENDYFACLRINGDLLFFRTEMSFDFISKLNSGDIVLNKQEFEKLKSSEEFDDILSYSHKIDDLGLDKVLGEPKGKIIIEIDEDFEKVKTKIGINYGKGNDILLADLGKVNFFIGKETENTENTVGTADLLSLQNQNTQNTKIQNQNTPKNRIIIERNKEAEKSILKELQTIENFTNIKTDFGFIKEVDDEIDDFFDEIEKLIEKDFIVEYSQDTKRVSNKKLGVSVQVKTGIDFFDTKTALTIGDEEVEKCAELLNLIGKSKNKKSITLKNGMTILLKNDLESSLDLLEDMGIDKKDIGGENVEISKHNIGLLKDRKSKNDIISFELDKETLLLKKSLSNFNGIKEVKVPENVKAQLRNYQQKGYDWLNFLERYNFSGILADDMGLGKTLQTLVLLQNMYNDKKLKQKSLVVCPTSLVFNWIDEAEKFTPDLKIEYIKDGKTAFSEIKKDTQIVIVSYGIIANLAEKGELKEKFHYLILDESQNIKNPVAKRTKSICKIVSRYRLALSGTPIENNLMELWSVFNFLMPGFLKNQNNFRSKYMSTNADKEILENLSSKVKPFILRRKKEDVLKDLPPKQEETIRLEMGPKQKAFYTRLKDAFKLQINKELEEQGLNKARFKVLDSLLKLRQACLTPQLINSSEKSITKESIKLDYVEQNIEEMLTNGHNLLIFSQFTGFLKYVREVLEKKKIDYNYLDGQTRGKDRKGLVDEFNNGKKQVFIISLKAGGTGLNLTKADYVIHLDPWWNPAVENQATDRAHRIGQKKTVFVQKLICKDSIEEKIVELQEKKKKLIDDVFSGNFSGSLSREDIDFIFE